MDFHPTKRFSNRVIHYTKFRPRYPDGILTSLADVHGFHQGSVVADIGAGTGLLTKLFLDHGNLVYGVEPNDEMRSAAETFLANVPHFISVAGTAEATTLPDNSVDLITAGQAFHWFDVVKSRIEFQRILKDGGVVALIWNTWDTETSPFMKAYERIFEAHAVEKKDSTVRARREQMVGRFFSSFETAVFAYVQHFDFEGLMGRTVSSSVAPLPEHPNYEPLLVALRSLFEQYEQEGQIEFLYRTLMFYGRI